MLIYRARTRQYFRHRQKQGYPFRTPVVPSLNDPKGHVPPTFQRSFQKTVVNGKQLWSRFPAHEGKFSLFPSSSPKGRATISFQCLQTNTSQISSFLTCSLSTFFNTRRKYWTNTEKNLRNTQTFHLTRRKYKDRTFRIKKLSRSTP